MKAVVINELPSSVHTVESNDDLLTEIFLRLTASSLFVFKSVSKRWLSLVTNPYITQRRSQIQNLEPPSGLLIKSSSGYDLVSLATNRSSLHSTTFKFSFDDCNVEILQSCNGLLLCCIKPHKYYVYNPSMNRFKKLPQVNLGSDYRFIGMKIAFDPTKSPHYKVVCVGYILCNHRFSFQIITYSSETCEWSVCGGEYHSKSLIGFSRGIYSSDAIHLLDSEDNLIIHLKLDDGRPYLRCTQLPWTTHWFKVHWDHKLFESCGHLLLVFIMDGNRSPKDGIHPKNLNVYEMKNVDSGWSMKYLFNVNDITKLIPKTLNISDTQLSWNVIRIIVGEKEEDSFLVIRVGGKVVQYKIVLKTLHKLYDLKSLSHHTDRTDFGCSQFIASFTGV